MPTHAKVFCAAYDNVGKVDLRKGCWNPGGKLGITAHFSKTIKGNLPYIVVF